MLGSGSSGNATLVNAGGCKILVDSGLSLRQLLLRCEMAGESLEGLKAILVTHEHADHVNGLGVLARRMDVPVYLTRGTLEALPAGVGRLPRVSIIEAGESFALNGMGVSSFSVSHDAADPVSFVIESAGTKLGIAGDLGHPSELVKQRLAGSHGLILESNYCPDMLRKGSYPPMVQQRIRGRHGHLSNQDMCSLLSDLLHEALRVVVLVHISEENNTPELAREMASGAIKGHPALIHVAGREKPTPVFELRS
ncbi:MAG: metal-dependent hydrolase [Candidatus Hydrogenedentota bacterium]